MQHLREVKQLKHDETYLMKVFTRYHQEKALLHASTIFFTYRVLPIDALLTTLHSNLLNAGYI